jgi:glycosyltransferase involved in cell wall biosynthesis
MRRFIMEIDYINGLKTTEIFGRSKYQKEIHKRLENIELNAIEYTPLSIKIKYKGIIDGYLMYPYLVRKKIKRSNIKHITSQELAYLLKLIKLEKTIVTCYDLIPWVYDKNRSLIWRLNMMGLRKADRMITISNFTKNEILKCIDGYHEDRIIVIYEGINHEKYKSLSNIDVEGIHSKYKIRENQKIILYVGSEQPRKNVPTLIKAFYKLKKKYDNVKLIKVGNPQDRNGRKEFLELIKELNLQKDIVIVDYVSEEDLPLLYNAADLYVSPTLYEGGFALPILEAMACGCPAVTSNIPPLIETVGADTEIMVNPYDVNGLAEAMYEVLMNEALRQAMIKKGLKRARMFTWDRAAKEMLKVYRSLE